MPGQSAEVDQFRDAVAAKFWSDDDPNGRWTQTVNQEDNFGCSNGDWQIDIELFTADPPVFTVTAQKENGQLAMTAKLAKNPGFRYPGWTYDQNTQTYSTTVPARSGITLTDAFVLQPQDGFHTIVVTGTSG